MPEDKVLNVRQAADLLGLSIKTLNRARLEGGGPPYVQLSAARIGYQHSALMSWLRSRTVTSTSAATVQRSKAA